MTTALVETVGASVSIRRSKHINSGTLGRQSTFTSRRRLLGRDWWGFEPPGTDRSWSSRVSPLPVAPTRDRSARPRDQGAVSRSGPPFLGLLGDGARSQGRRISSGSTSAFEDPRRPSSACSGLGGRMGTPRWRRCRPRSDGRSALPRTGPGSWTPAPKCTCRFLPSPDSEKLYSDGHRTSAYGLEAVAGQVPEHLFGPLVPRRVVVQRYRSLVFGRRLSSSL